jgi:N-acyl-D-aspartate/D-glutamate deacylase
MRYCLWVSAVSILVFLNSASAEAQGRADVLLRGGMLLDGTGSPARRADVAIRDGRIAAVGDLPSWVATRAIDVAGLYVTPGFIDLHSHAELGLSDPHLAEARNNLTQGITTVVVGQDGRHAWPLGGTLAEQAAVWRRHGVGNNVVPLIGQGSARIEAVGWSEEPASADQSMAIAERVAAVLKEGAWGISTGLGYFPGRHSSTEEIIEATVPVKAIDGFYISHLRNQGDRLMESIEETIRIGKEAGVRAVATHIKSAGRRNWGKASEAMATIARAREEGLPIYADLYPYDTSSDGIDVALVPVGALFGRDEIGPLMAPAGSSSKEVLDWAYRLNPALSFRVTRSFAEAQPPDVIYRNLFDIDRLRSEPAYRHRLREVLADAARAPELLRAVAERIEGPGGGDLFEIAGHPDEDLVGLRLSEIASSRGLSEARTAVQLTLEGASFTQLHMAEEDVATFIQQPFMAACTDGWIPEYGQGWTHPRSYGTFTRRIRRYVYDLRVIELPFAVHSATGLAAEIIGLEDRGTIQEGHWADVIAFDPRKVRDRATYRHPHRFSEGIEWVLVNGEAVVEQGMPNGRRAGRVLLKTEAAPPSENDRK